MQKRIFHLLFIVLMPVFCLAQVKWGTDTMRLTNREWNNYSTTYLEPENAATTPVLVTAVPYKGIYSHSDEYGWPMSVTFKGSLFNFKSTLSARMQRLYTYDSSDVYFITPGIHTNNAGSYEYRVTLNGTKIIKPWQQVTQFAGQSFALNNFKLNPGFLGGYRTVWDNFITVELRKKGNDTSFATSTVYWKQTRPKLLQIYRPADFLDPLSLLKGTYNPYSAVLQDGALNRWKKEYAADELDPVTHLPKKLVLQPWDNNVVFYLTTGIFKKEAIEYQLLKNGKVVNDWQCNDFDNGFIWLRNLAHGNYLLRLRYSAQRHNVTEYPFEVKPQWYQTGWFITIVSVTGLLISAFAIVFYRLVQQRRQTEIEQAKKNRLALELKAIHAQLNPHFIFNSLNSIQGLVNSNDVKGANHYLAGFANLLRSTLAGSDNNFIPLQNEVPALENYLSLEKLRFGFSYRITIDGNINTSETEIPSLLLQPLVENAVKHGVAGLQQNGQINIGFAKHGCDMQVTVYDNGSGYLPRHGATGYGMKLTGDRIALLNEVLQGQSIVLRIAAGMPNGTTITLLFKNWFV